MNSAIALIINFLLNNERSFLPILFCLCHSSCSALLKEIALAALIVHLQSVADPSPYFEFYIENSIGSYDSYLTFVSFHTFTTFVSFHICVSFHTFALFHTILLFHTCVSFHTVYVSVMHLFSCLLTFLFT